jgi:hypothetical protein
MIYDFNGGNVAFAGDCVTQLPFVEIEQIPPRRVKIVVKLPLPCLASMLVTTLAPVSVAVGQIVLSPPETASPPPHLDFSPTNGICAGSNTVPRVFPPASSYPLHPGIYQTRPYACMVKVPGPLPDDVCVIGGKGGESEMPTYKPGLRFVPQPPAKR